MPLYEYQCESCGNRFEKIQKSFSEPPIETCPKCGKGPVRKLISSPAIQFKGSGWYITDYAKKSGSDTGQAGGGTSATSTDKSDTAAKPETKTDSGTSSTSDSTAAKTTKTD